MKLDIDNTRFMEETGPGGARNLMQECPGRIGTNEAAAWLIDHAPFWRQIEVGIAFIEGSACQHFKGQSIIAAECCGPPHHRTFLRPGIDPAAIDQQSFAGHFAPLLPAFPTGRRHFHIDRSLMRRPAIDARIAMRRAAIVERSKLLESRHLDSVDS